MRRLFALLLMLIAVPVSAQRDEPEWRRAREEQVLVRAGGFEPSPLVLEAGRPTRLVFHNGGRTRLSLSAGRFFAASRVRRGDLDLVRNGRIVLRPGETRIVTLVPAAGRYRLSSGSRFRRFLGMSTRIIVEEPRSAAR